MKVPGQRFVFVGIAVACAVLFFGLRTFSEVNLSGAQFVIFPFVLFGLVLLRLSRFRIPDLILAAALTSFLLAVYVNFRMPNEAGAYIVARLLDDPYEVETSLFRENLRNYSHTYLAPLPSGASPLRYHGEVQNFEQARALLDSASDITAVIWGRARWLNVSFRETPFLNLRDLTGRRDVIPLRIVRSVPVIGLSLQPAADSSAFLAELLSNPLLPGSGAPEAGGLQPESETGLMNAGLMVGAWTTFAHRAYPWWLLGNAYLEQAFRSGEVQPGYLKCARRAYMRAAGFVLPTDNAELYAAIQNNFAVLEYLDFLEGKRDKLDSALHHLRNAYRAGDIVDGWELESEVPPLSRNNFKRLRRFRNSIESENIGQTTIEKTENQKGKRKRKRSK